MFGANVNLLAVLVAGIVSTIIGGLWYSPLLFGNLWLKLNGISLKQAKQMRKEGGSSCYVYGLIQGLVTAYVLGLFMYYTNVASIANGVFISFWAWLGFVATTQIGAVLWEKKPFGLFLINASHQLVSLVVMAIILVAWAI